MNIVRRFVCPNCRIVLRLIGRNEYRCERCGLARGE